MEKLDDSLCKVCGERLKDRKAAHAHVKKKHSLSLGEYYTQYYPRYNLFDNTLIGYKGDVDRYFTEDFFNIKQMLAWINTASPEQVKKWTLNRLKSRIEGKNLSYAPTSVELETINMMPQLDLIERLFGSYEAACEEIGYEPLLKTKKEIPQVQVKNPTICVDTREQKPLHFKNSKVMTLAYADYTLHGDDYTYTYVDRKSGPDFLGTFGKGHERFERELQRAIDMDSFIYVVIEETVRSVKVGAKNLNRGLRPEYSFKNMRRILHKYPRKVQFIFTGSRAASQQLIPFLLAHGKDLWDYDAYYALKRKGLI